MFTVPDAPDAVASCPPISPVGPIPDGFFADCNPGANFAGTRPIAEHFNELILNLRALLTQAGVAPVKGDPTMLWRAILLMGIISQNVTLNVTPSGAAAPANPFGGDPFNSVASALSFLARYRIAGGATVTISVAAGTYSATTTTVVYHADGIRIVITGNGQATTILSYTQSSGGILVLGELGALRNLTVQGDGSHPGTGSYDGVSGLWVSAGSFAQLGNVTFNGFGAHGIVVDGGRVNFDNGSTVTVSQNHLLGLNLLNGGAINATVATLEADNNVQNQVVLAGSTVMQADTVHTTGGSGTAVGVQSGSSLIARKLGVDVCGVASAVSASDGGRMIARYDAVAGDWWTWKVTANQPQNFYATMTGFIESGVAMAANNRANCSPALNTLGNTQAYVQGT